MAFDVILSYRMTENSKSVSLRAHATICATRKTMLSRIALTSDAFVVFELIPIIPAVA